jgi:hypothetical protein
MLYENVRVSRDDLVPLMVDDALVVAKTIELCHKNCPVDVMIWEISDVSGIDDLTWDELKQFIVDAQEIELLAEVAIAGDELPAAIIRSAAPSGLGVGSGNVWITPIGESYTIRWYVNGIYKMTMNNYNLITLSEIGAISGDIVQVAQVVDDVVGWWSRIVVP